MENEEETVVTQTDTETTENQEGETTPKVDVEALKKENATLQAQKEHWRKKAEEKVEKTETKVEVSKDDLSSKELYALIEAKVPKEDVEFITNWAKFNKFGVIDALNQKEVKSILALRAEERQSAEVANTAGGRRVSTKDTGTDLLEKFNKGQLPPEEDIEKMLNAKYEAKKKKN